MRYCGEGESEAAKRLSIYVGKDVVARRADDNHGAGCLGAGKRCEAENLAGTIEVADHVPAAGAVAHSLQQRVVGEAGAEAQPTGGRAGEDGSGIALDHHQDPLVVPGDPVGEFRERLEVYAYVDDAGLGPRGR